MEIANMRRRTKLHFSFWWFHLIWISSFLLSHWMSSFLFHWGFLEWTCMIGASVSSLKVVCACSIRYIEMWCISIGVPSWEAMRTRYGLAQGLLRTVAMGTYATDGASFNGPTFSSDPPATSVFNAIDFCVWSRVQVKPLCNTWSSRNSHETSENFWVSSIILGYSINVFLLEIVSCKMFV